MKKYLLIALLLPFVISCQEKRWDWDTVHLPIPLDSMSKGYALQPYGTYQDQGLELYKTVDKNLLIFSGIALDAKAAYNNSAMLYIADADKTIQGVSLFTEDIAHTEALVKAVEDNLGNADYHYYYNEDAVPARDRIWKKGNRYYTLRVKDPDYLSGTKTKTACLTLFSAESSAFLDFWFYGGGDFSGFYGQYLDESKKEEHKNKTYTYRDFVAQMDREHKNEGTTSQFFVR